MDKQTLLKVAETLRAYHFEEQGKIDHAPKGASNEIKTLRQISRTNGINDCINIVDTLLLQCDTDSFESKKKTFYCVVSKFFDGGGVKAVLFDIQADEKPQSSQVENSLCDEYHDYFDTYAEASEFQKSVYRA